MTEYQPTWNSLRKHHTPEWFRDAKLGIYTHWGIYSVPACGPNASWYPFFMYKEGKPQHAHHVENYGGPENFGYKDFIPDFTGEKFDADEWAETFKNAGARFAGPVGEHHDGFSMWDSLTNQWNSAKMGPKRDVVGELEKACRAHGMKYMVAMHHAENWWFYPHWRKEFDTSDPRYAGLYGEPHNPNGPNDDHPFFNQNLPSPAFLAQWRTRLNEVVERYKPDLLWFDFGLSMVEESCIQDFLAYYYNKEAQWDRELVVTYKWNDVPPNIGLLDHELGSETEMTYHEWLTDSTVDDGQGWGYVRDTGYKSPTTLIHYLVDNVSKNGALLLNVGPKPDGTFPDEARTILKEMGKWLLVNGEAIYGTTPWFVPGEGPSKLEKAGAFGESARPNYNAKDIRFTVNDDALYAICLGWPGESVTVETLKGSKLYPGTVKSITMLGSEEPLRWQETGSGLVITTPSKKPCDHAYAFKIERS